MLHPAAIARFRGAVAACASPERLCESAARHGMLGHLHHVMRGDPSATYDAELSVRVAELYRTWAERSLRQSAHLLQILAAMDARGVAALTVKGPTWAELLYGDVTLRNWVDLDLVVAHHQAAAARDVLIGLGLEDGQVFAEHLLDRERHTEGEVSMHSADKDLLVDIHWQVGVGYSGGALTGERLLAAAETRQLLGRPVRVPSATDTVLLMAVHGARHRWANVEDLLGLAVTTSRTPESAWPGDPYHCGGLGLPATDRHRRCSRLPGPGAARSCSDRRRRARVAGRSRPAGRSRAG